MSSPASSFSIAQAVHSELIIKKSRFIGCVEPCSGREAALALIGQGADVLTNHSGSPAVPQAAEEAGVKVIAYQSDMARFAPTAQLAAVTHHWGGHYTQVARSVLEGRWELRSPARRRG